MSELADKFASAFMVVFPITLIVCCVAVIVAALTLVYMQIYNLFHRSDGE